MKRIANLVIGILAALVVLLPVPAGAAEDGGMIAGAGAAAFPGGVIFAGIPLTSLEFGQGVVTASDGSAVGAFHAVLRGSLPLGGAQLVAVDGTVTTGGVAGAATFGGLATVTLGAGAPAPGVPFQVSVTTNGLQLTLDSTVFPAVTVAPGAIAIE